MSLINIFRRPRSAPVARVMVSSEVLLESIGFPAGTEILDIRSGSAYGEFEMTIRHEALMPVEEGMVMPTITPTFVRLPDGTPELKSWGNR